LKRAGKKKLEGGKKRFEKSSKKGEIGESRRRRGRMFWGREGGGAKP